MLVILRFENTTLIFYSSWSTLLTTTTSLRFGEKNLLVKKWKKERRLSSSSVPLIETDSLPPETTEDGPDENVHHAADTADAEVILELDVTGAVVARGLSRGVVRDAAKEVSVERHGETDQHRRSTGGHHHRHECRGERGDLGGLRRKQVVNGVVETVEQEHDLRPSQVGRGESSGDGGGEVIDETERVELR